MSMKAIKMILAPKGRVTMNVRDDQGNIIETIESPNLVVTAGRAALAQLIGAGNAADFQVQFMAWGEGGVPPVASDTAITTPYTNAFQAITYPAPNRVQFAFALSSAEGNGKSLRELGLICADGTTLFARYTWGGQIDKTAAVSIDGTWIIEF